MRLEYSKANVIRGILIYSSGDTVAALLLGQFMWSRLAGLALVAATVYAFEIPNYFNWIDRKTAAARFPATSRTALALLYFNPLWITRHLLFIKIFSRQWHAITWGLLQTGLISFLVNIPISALANYIIQNRIPLKWRFTASAVFSALMAIYYAVSAVVF